MSGLKTALASLWSPVRALAEAAEKGRFVWPLLLVTLIGVGFTALAVTRLDFAGPARDRLELTPEHAKMTPHEREEKVAQGVKIAIVGSFAKAAAGPAFTALLAAFCLWLGFKVAGGKPAFGATFAVVAHAWLPEAVKHLATLPALLKHASVEVMDFPLLLPSSLAALAPEGTSLPKLALLGSVDLFSLWSVAMVAAGMAWAGKVSALRSTVVTVLLWASYVAVFSFAIPTLSMASQ